MCNRFIPSFIHLLRFQGMIASIPRFEEFTEKPKYKPAQAIALSPSSSAVNSSGPGKDEQDPEALPTELRPVLRVIDGELRIDSFKWGLVPPHEPEPNVSYSTFNAKAEAIAKTSAYAHAWKARERCLIPTKAFIEWKGDRPPKQKYRISLKGQSEIFLGGPLGKMATR